MKTKEEIMLLWIETGGLVTKKLASVITGIAESNICMRANKGEIKEYQIEGTKTKYLAFNEVIKIKRQRAKPRNKKNNNKVKENDKVQM